MLSKDFLSRYKMLIKNYDEKRDLYLTLKIKYESLGFGSALSDDRVMGGMVNPDKFTDLLVKVMQAEKDMKIAEKTLHEYLKIAFSRIDSLSSDYYKQILKLKYFKFLSNAQIARKLNVSVQWYCKLHKKALREFDKKYYA